VVVSFFHDDFSIVYRAHPELVEGSERLILQQVQDERKEFRIDFDRDIYSLKNCNFK